MCNTGVEDTEGVVSFGNMCACLSLIGEAAVAVVMAKTLARIAESGFLWEVFRESKWFPYSSIEDGRIREANLVGQRN